MEEKVKPVFKIVSVVWIYGFWIIISFFIWKPLLILPLILLSGYLSTYLRRNFIYGGYFRSIMSGIVFGLILSFVIYFLCGYTQSPFWYRILVYILGLYGVGYIGYGKHEILPSTKLENFYVIAQFTALSIYILFLLMLSFFRF